MSADGKKDVSKLEFEDPARNWIDLVQACHSGDPLRVRELLAVAKKSEWNHDLWNEATNDMSDVEEDEEAGGEIDLTESQDMKKMKYA